MTTSDAFVWITCDGCDAEEQAELPFVFGDIMHTHGHYDHDKPRLPDGWVKTGEDAHLCEECAKTDEAAA